MVVEISRDVIEYIENHLSELDCTSPICRNLDDIALQCCRRHHVIYAEYDVLDYLKKCKLLNELSRQVYTTLLGKAYMLYEYVAITKFRICYYVGTDLKNTGDKLLVPITEKTDLEQSLLICENLSDCDFYISLVNEIYEEKKSAIAISLHKLQCAGSQAIQTISNELEEGIVRPIACIMDSDKKREGDSFGTSAKSALRALAAGKNMNAISVHVLSVREKENVIPPNLLLIHPLFNNNELVNALSKGICMPECYELLKFINIKDGIQDVKTSKEYEFHQNACEALGLLKMPTIPSNGNHVDGIGGNGISCFVKDVLNHGFDSEYKRVCEIEGVPADTLEKLEKLADATHNLLQDLPEYIKPEWAEIEQLITDYGITIPPTLGLVS